MRKFPIIVLIVLSLAGCLSQTQQEIITEANGFKLVTDNANKTIQLFVTSGSVNPTDAKVAADATKDLDNTVPQIVSGVKNNTYDSTLMDEVIADSWTVSRVLMEVTPCTRPCCPTVPAK